MWLLYFIGAIAAPIIIRHVILLILHRIAPIQNPHHPPPSQSPMDEAEARNILGVSSNATTKEIQTAYHQLMQKLHPDVGGNDYFASQLNRARDILLKRTGQSS